MHNLNVFQITELLHNSLFVPLVNCRGSPQVQAPLDGNQWKGKPLISISLQEEKHLISYDI